MHTKLWKLTPLLLILLLPGLVTAQNFLTYGSLVTGSLDNQNRVQVYSFEGSQGDQVTVRATAISAGLDTALTLQGPGGAFVENDDDPLTPGSDSRIDYRLPTSGFYTVLVSAAEGQSGDFVLKLDGRPAAEAAAVGDEPVSSALSEDSVQVFSVEASADAPTVVTLSTEPADYRISALLRDGDGEIAGASTGSAPTFAIPAGDGSYQIEVRALSDGEGSVTVLSSAAGAAPGTAETEPQTETQTSTSTETTSSADDNGATDCRVTSVSASGVNVRGGPGTEFAVVGVLTQGTTADVLGVNGDWYSISAIGIGEGWVRNDTVLASGDCDELPVVDVVSDEPTVTPSPTSATATPSPTTANITATPTAPGITATATTTVGVTATSTTANVTETFTPTPSATSTVTQTFTPSYTPTTPPPPQLAPEDPRFNGPLSIPLDQTVSILDFVSYPDGDREDRVRYEVTGMNPNAALPGGRAQLTIAVSCFGTGLDNIQIQVGNQTFSCGQTLVDREVTADSDTGSLIITAIGGEGTYVQWVLTGTATRLN